jgi:2Fe-2S ferredoxin
MSDAESDRLDMGFDVRPYSRLGCQVKVGAADLVVELTQESIRTWYDEHPQARKP